jgi:hypothetical protein
MVTRNRMFGRPAGVLVPREEARAPAARVKVPRRTLGLVMAAVAAASAVAVFAPGLGHGRSAPQASAGNVTAPATAAKGDPPFVVIVAPDWRSDPAARSLLELDSIRAAAGLPPSAVVVDSEAEAAAVVQGIRDSNAIRNALGLPEVIVEDLTAW